MKASAGGTFDEVEHVLTVTKGIKHWSNCAELHAHVAEKQHQVGNASHLEQHRTNPLRALRSFDTKQLLDGENEGNLVGETRQPVDAIDQRSYLRIATNFGELFVAAVHITTHRI